MTGRWFERAARSRGRGVIAAAMAAGLVLAAPAPAHEIPADVTVRMIAQRDAGRLDLLVRVPVESLRDLDLPRTGTGALDVPAALPLLRDAAGLWIADYLVLTADGAGAMDPRVTEVAVAAPSDRSFDGSFDDALASLRTRPAPGGVPVEHALLDVHLTFDLAPGADDLVLTSGLHHLGIRTETVLRHGGAGGPDRILRWEGDPGPVRLDPAWYHAAASFVQTGFVHILGGIDHLLFLLVLVVPYRRLAPLVPVVTAFTVAHSITLGAAALGFTPGALWFGPLIETLIAGSIVWMALENVLGAGLRRRWAVAFGFGLVHGFGFSFLLTESLAFAGGHLVVALLTFNIGVELGQLAVLAVAVPILALMVRWVGTIPTRSLAGDARIDPRRLTTIVVSVVLAHTAWHWMTARGADLLAHDIRAPTMDAFFLADLMRWVALGLVALAAARLTHEAFRRLSRRVPAMLEGSGLPDPVHGET